jgi:hypothetical protein
MTAVAYSSISPRKIGAAASVRDCSAGHGGLPFVRMQTVPNRVVLGEERPTPGSVVGLSLSGFVERSDCLDRGRLHQLVDNAFLHRIGLSFRFFGLLGDFDPGRLPC